MKQSRIVMWILKLGVKVVLLCFLAPGQWKVTSSGWHGKGQLGNLRFSQFFTFMMQKSPQWAAPHTFFPYNWTSRHLLSYTSYLTHNPHFSKSHANLSFSQVQIPGDCLNFLFIPMPNLFWNPIDTVFKNTQTPTNQGLCYFPSYCSLNHHHAYPGLLK